jgi:glycosyltransferase involved in cell wall biosynthesis
MSDKIPVLSVLMTAFNQEKYIAEAIESVLASTFRDFELIIVDDCSQDRTVEIAKQFESIDNRIRLYLNENNLGDYPNRNKAASYAKGKYLKYVDADDMMYPYGLEYIVKYMDGHPEADWGLTDINQDDHAIFPYMVSNLEIYKSHYLTVKNIFSKAPSSLVIKKSFFQSTGGFIEMKGVSDIEYVYRIALNSKLLLMPYGYMWCRGETKGSQSSIHYRNLALHLMYDEIEAFYLERADLDCEDFTHFKKINRKRRLKNYIKVILDGPNTIKNLFHLKRQLLKQINSKLN